MHPENLVLIVERVEQANSLNESLHSCAKGISELIYSVSRDPHLGCLGLCVTGFAAIRIEELKKLEKYLYSKRPDPCAHCTSYLHSNMNTWFRISRVTLMTGEESTSDEIKNLRALEHGSWVQYVPVELTLPERIEIAKEELALIVENCGQWIFYWREHGRNPVFDFVLRCTCI